MLPTNHNHDDYGTKRHRSAMVGYLARPRLGNVRSVYSTKPFYTGTKSDGKRTKNRKLFMDSSTAGTSMKMDPSLMYSKKRSNPVDTAYRDAVGRLKILLAESYTIPIPIRASGGAGARYESAEETDNQSLLSSRSRHSHHHYPQKYHHYQFMNRRYPFLSNTKYKTTDQPKTEIKNGLPKNENAENQCTPEMMSFIHQQEDYIEQLEREAQYCRGELSGLLDQVKQVISENDHLHNKQKSKLLSGHFNSETETELELFKSIQKSPKRKHEATKIRLEGPSIVFESRISELEAQLTQIRIELKKCQEENENYKTKIANGTLTDRISTENWKLQMENLQRDKTNLQEQSVRLHYELNELRNRNSDTSEKMKRTFDVAEQTQFEKSQLETEVRRLSDELERQHERVRETMQEQSRRLTEERVATERRYQQQIDQTQTDRNVQWEQANKLQLELERQRRDENELRRQLAQKQAHVDDLTKQLQTKTGVAGLQSDLVTSNAERDALDQQIASLQLTIERTERTAKQDTNRWQVEIQSLRQRLDRADADLVHSRRENLRLNEQIASLEKQLNLSGGNALISVPVTASPSPAPITPTPTVVATISNEREKELSSMIHQMESKHVATVAELEGMIQSQNQLMEKLTNECYSLTQKLEDSSNRHKTEIQQLQTNLDYLTNIFQEQQQLAHEEIQQQQHIDQTAYYDSNVQQPQPSLSLSQQRNHVTNNASISDNNNQLLLQEPEEHTEQVENQYEQYPDEYYLQEPEESQQQQQQPQYHPTEDPHYYSNNNSSHQNEPTENR